MKKRSVSIEGHRTSIALEPEFWTALEAFATQDDVSLAGLIAQVDQSRISQDPAPGLASALRVYVLRRLTGGS